MEKSVDERSLKMTCARMDDHTRRFIYHDDVFILVQNFKRQLFWLGVQRREFGRRDGYGVASAQKMRGPGRRLVDLHAVLFDPSLQTGTAIFGQAFMNE